MAVRYVQRRLNGGGRSIEEVEPPPESLEVSKYFSSVQRYIKIRGCKCGSNREVICLWVSMCISLSSSQCIAHPIQMPLTHSSTGCLTMHPMMSQRQKHDPSLISLIQGQDDSKALVLVPNTSTSPSTEPRNKDVVIDIGSDSESGDSNVQYYYEPRSRRQFRSNKEVLCYLETGTRRKYKGKSQDKSNTGVNVMPSEQNGSSPEKRKRSGSNFDFDNPPKKVTWVLNSFPEAPGSWSSFISGEVVPGHTRQEWDAAFTYHVHGVVASSSKVDEVGVNLQAGA